MDNSEDTGPAARIKQAREQAVADAHAVGVNPAFISRLVDRFYERIRADEVLAPIFASRIKPEDCTFGQVVAEGAYGKVYKGKWIGKPVAIKEMHDPDEDPAASDDFDDTEVQTMLRLRHPHLCFFYGCGRRTVNGSVHRFIVVEWCEGGALTGILQDESVDKTWEWRLRATLDSAEGLAYLHTEHFVHRDVKSLNVLVDHKGQCKVSDDFAGCWRFAVRVQNDRIAGVILRHRSRISGGRARSPRNPAESCSVRETRKSRRAPCTRASTARVRFNV